LKARSGVSDSREEVVATLFNVADSALQARIIRELLEGKR
jgi:hypothetical protein